MKILLLRSGGREHALAWKLSRTPNVQMIFVLPGNAGTADCGTKVSNIGSSKHATFDEMLQHVRYLGIDFVLPSQESHYADGIWDYFALNGVACLGPSRAAAQLESSKRFAKGFMLHHNIPTPRSWVCEDLASVKQILSQNQDWPVVVKASGLTAGKGVVLATTETEALQSAATMLSIEHPQHEEGSQPCLLLEEYHSGPEFSVVALTDGTDLLMFPPIKDYKRKENGDKGPNTGGMGCVAPTPLCPEYVLEHVKHDILLSILQGMRAEGNVFTGVLCVDVVLGKRGLVVLDIDARFGDAETQTLLPLIDDTTDLMAALLACNKGTVRDIHWQMTEDHCVSVVAATDDYPEWRPQEIKIPRAACLNIIAKALLFLGMSKMHNNDTVAQGGRVFTVSAISGSCKDAVNRVRVTMETLRFPGMHFRTDIGLD